MKLNVLQNDVVRHIFVKQWNIKFNLSKVSVEIGPPDYYTYDDFGFRSSNLKEKDFFFKWEWCNQLDEWC